MDYVEWLNQNKFRQKPVLSEFQKYTMSQMVNQLEDYTTFSLAIGIISEPEPFIKFLAEECEFDVADKEITVVWPQCPINKNIRLDLLIGFSHPHDRSKIISCLIIESKIDDDLTEEQLEKYLGITGNCDYLAITKYPEERVDLANWHLITWQGLADSGVMKKLENNLWQEIFQSMAQHGTIVNLRAEPEMKMDDFPKLIATARKIMEKVLDHYYSEKIRSRLENCGFYYYQRGQKKRHWNHMLKDQLMRCNRFTIACEDRDLKKYKSWLLFGLFLWKDGNGEPIEWHAGAVIERKPDEKPVEFKRELMELQENGVISPEWKLFEPSDSLGTDFNQYLVAMKSKPIRDFADCSSVVQYLNGIISGMTEEPFASMSKNVIHNFPIQDSSDD
jgi:hypothetical protein